MLKKITSYKKTSLIVSLSLISHYKKCFPFSSSSQIEAHYDLAIIGGGTGGLALAMESKQLGLKPILFDYVTPTPHNNKWGLGGCCVNVGCIPKKLFHQAGLLSDAINLSEDYGFQLENKSFSLGKLKQSVQTYIKSLNFGYRSSLIDKGITYVNAMASLEDKNTIVFNNSRIKADYIVLAVGGRPKGLPIEGQHLAISSDDIFFQSNMGKTLVVGGGYIAVECAGFLGSLGHEVSMMTRGIFLREFDQDIAKRIVRDLEVLHHVKILGYKLPIKLEKTTDGRIKVLYQDQQDTNLYFEEIFDTVLMAVGREPAISKIGLEKAGVLYDEKTKKIIGGYHDHPESTSIDNIFAVGDVLQNMPELQSVALKGGRMLAHRIKALKEKNPHYNRFKVDYSMVPTTVFSPTEYGCCGMSEEKAVQQYTKEKIIVYHSEFTPLEQWLNSKITDDFDPLRAKSYVKVVCEKNSLKVLGIHYYGPHAGEVLQGFSVAMKMGLTKQILDESFGIHPTSAEEICDLKVTKESGEPYEKETC